MEDLLQKAVPLLCVFGLGMCFALLGAISVKLMPRVKIDEGKFGSLISVFMFACLVASLIVGVVIDSIGYKPVAVFGFVAAAICFLLIARSQSYGTTLLACVLLGLGAMALNAAGNTLIPVVLFGGKKASAALNIGNVFFGLGLFLTPLIASFLFRKTSYATAVSVLAVIILAPAILAVLATYPEKQAGFKILDAVALLKEPAVLAGAFLLFFYLSLEISFCNWLAPYGKEVLGAANPEAEAGAIDASAQRVLSVFAIAMMAGRFTASQIPAIGSHGQYFIVGAAVVLAVVVAIMMVSKSAGLVWVLAAVAGLACAPCFPTTVGLTFDRTDPGVAGSVFGIIFAVGLAGAVIVPKAIGNMAKGATIRKGLGLLIPPAVLVIVLVLLLGGIDKFVKVPAVEAPKVPTPPALPVME